MSSEAFQNWLKSSNIDYEKLNSVEKVKYRKEFDSKHVETEKFLFHSKFLSSWGLTGRDDQYILYGTFGAGIGMYSHVTYKHYKLRSYIRELHPDAVITKGFYIPIEGGELSTAQKYLNANIYKSRLCLIAPPLAFIVFEVFKRGPKFWEWKKQLS